MEAAGLAIGVASLGGVMSSGRDLKDFYDSYRNAIAESKPYVIQHDATQFLLQQWLEKVGYKNGSLDENHHPALDDPKVREVVDRIIASLLTGDSSKVNGYDLLGDQFLEHSGVQKSLRSPRSARLKSHVEGKREKPSRISKLAWAFQGKARASEQTQIAASLLSLLQQLAPPQHDDTGFSHWNSGTLSSIRDEIENALKEARIIETKRRKDDFLRDLHRWIETTSLGSSTLDTFLQRRSTGTCEWIFKHPAYIEWNGDEPGRPNVLWIHGPAGYGKTILCARITETLQQHVSPVVHYFFSTESVHRSDPLTVIRAWLCQLITQDDEALKLAQKLWDGKNRETASISDVKELLKSILRAFPSSVLIVDGLDECGATGGDAATPHKDNLEAFWKVLQETLTDRTRVLVVSRDVQAVRAGLEVGQSRQRWHLCDCSFGPGDVSDDARTFASRIINEKFTTRSQSQRNDLIDLVLERFDSMFLGIQMVDRQISGWESQGKTREIIAHTSTELKKLYDKEWEMINRLDKHEQNRAWTILRWAAYAWRPLTVAEMAEVLVITDGKYDEITHDDYPQTINETYVSEVILGICGSMVEVRGSSDNPASQTIHLAHFSVFEYIFHHMFGHSSRITTHDDSAFEHFKSQNNIIATTLLRYLDSSLAWGRKKQSPEQPQVAGALQQYASNYWQIHPCLDAENGVQVRDLANQFFSIPHNNYWKLWARQVDAGVPPYLAPQTDINEFNALFYAALRGLDFTLEYLIQEHGLDVNTVDSDGRSALMAAATHKSARTLKLLIDNGACVNYSKRGTTALHIALVHGNRDAIQVLLDNGAEMSVFEDERKDTPLIYAATWSLEIVKLIHEHDSDINCTNMEGLTALSAASERGKLDIVEMLLDSGADPDAGWPLVFAATRGHSEIVTLLIERGSDLSKPFIDNSNTQTPVVAAALNSHIEVLRVLLGKGASLTVSDNFGFCPLSAIIQTGSLEGVHFLLQSGAELRVPDVHGFLPIHRAANGGRIDLVKLLLAEGASLAVSDNHGINPLTYAVRGLGEGMADIIKPLLQLGADPSGRGNKKNAPIHVAAKLGLNSVIKTLLGLGVDISALDGTRKWNPLLIAIDHGHLDTVEFLLEEGADPRGPEITMRRPVEFAAGLGRADIVAALLAKGASLACSENNGFSPLCRAIENLKTETWKDILELGADPSELSRLDDGESQEWTPLLAAVGYGRIEVVRELAKRVQVIEASRNGGSNPLCVAINSRHSELVEELLELGASLTGPCGCSGGPLHTPLTMAVVCGNVAVVELLLANGATLAADENAGYNVLVLALGRNQLPMAHFLLGNGADLLTPNLDGYTPLMRAVHAGRQDIAHMILSKGGTLGVAENAGLSPLVEAIDRGHLHMVEYLLDAGADISTPEESGWTALTMAASYGYGGVCQALVARGASLDSDDNDGRDPVEKAAQEGHADLARLLEIWKLSRDGESWAINSDADSWTTCSGTETWESASDEGPRYQEE